MLAARADDGRYGAFRFTFNESPYAVASPSRTVWVNGGTISLR